MSTETSIVLNEWLERATLPQRKAAYELAGTSRRTLWQIATGRRGLSVDKAAVIEKATLAIHQEDPTLPPVLRTSTCEACAACPYAKKCGAV